MVACLATAAAARPVPVDAATEASRVPPRVIDELAGMMKRPAQRQGHAEKVRHYSKVIREARAYAAEYADAPNLYEVRGIMLAALQARMNLESSVETYRALLKTAERIMAADAPPAAKLEADLVLVRETIRMEELDDSALRKTIVDFAGRYQDEAAGAKALMYASMLGV